MNQYSEMIVVTGAAGFIGSALVGFLNSKGYHNLILVDDFTDAEKTPNLHEKKYLEAIDREHFFSWLERHNPHIDFVFHLGARTDTTEFNYAVHQHLNLDYSKKIWDYCVIQNIPLVYASSAATYGNGSLGYSDVHERVHQLKPLNPYGVSKNEFDKWVLHENAHPPFWAGLKFFNVYGPNEYHKARMASVIMHAFHQIQETGKMKLFRSHRPDFKDGQQLRDFVYVKDVLRVCYWLMQHRPPSAIYNVGTGKARSFLDLTIATFAAMHRTADIEFIDMPEDIRDTYQYYTEADMRKLLSAGYDQSFYSLEDGVTDYVRHYLMPHAYL